MNTISYVLARLTVLVGTFIEVFVDKDPSVWMAALAVTIVLDTRQPSP